MPSLDVNSTLGEFQLFAASLTDPVNKVFFFYLLPDFDLTRDGDLKC